MNYASGIGESVRMAVEIEAFGVGDVQRRRFARFVDGIRRPFFQTQFLVRLGPALYQSSIYLFLAAGLGFLALINAHHIALLGAVILLLIRAGVYGQEAQANYQVCVRRCRMSTACRRPRNGMPRALAPWEGNHYGALAPWPSMK